MPDTKKKTVWILGAGFSKSLGAPLLVDLFTEESADMALDVYKGAMTDEIAKDLAKICQAGSYEPTTQHTLQRQWRHAEEFLEVLELGQPDDNRYRRKLRSFVRVVQGSGGDTNAQKRKSAERKLRLFGPGATYGRGYDEALKLLAAECCMFLEDPGGGPEQEKWIPYRRWAERLTHRDTIITFNYDRVLDVLNTTGSLQILLPSEALDQRNPGKEPDYARVLKLHGCNRSGGVLSS